MMNSTLFTRTMVILLLSLLILLSWDLREHLMMLLDFPLRFTPHSFLLIFFFSVFFFLLSNSFFSFSFSIFFSCALSPSFFFFFLSFAYYFSFFPLFKLPTLLFFPPFFFRPCKSPMLCLDYQEPSLCWMERDILRC